jgi:cleavage and polyadenylation specificity factor subunit 3
MNMASKRKHAAMEPEDMEPIDPADELMFLCLGGGNEVGRSCHILQYKGKTVMVRSVSPQLALQDANWWV